MSSYYYAAWGYSSSGGGYAYDDYVDYVDTGAQQRAQFNAGRAIGQVEGYREGRAVGAAIGSSSSASAAAAASTSASNKAKTVPRIESKKTSARTEQQKTIAAPTLSAKGQSAHVTKDAFDKYKQHKEKAQEYSLLLANKGGNNSKANSTQARAMTTRANGGAAKAVTSGGTVVSQAAQDKYAEHKSKTKTRDGNYPWTAGNGVKANNGGGSKVNTQQATVRDRSIMMGEMAAGYYPPQPYAGLQPAGTARSAASTQHRVAGRSGMSQPGRGNSQQQQQPQKSQRRSSQQQPRGSQQQGMSRLR